MVINLFYILNVKKIYIANNYSIYLRISYNLMLRFKKYILEVYLYSSFKNE